jgi:thiol-disulfide isomerase/thioredoxin
MRKIFFFIAIASFFGCRDSKKSINISNNSIENISYLVDLDGNSYNTSKLKGKKVLLNFWATWCGPCKKEMPDLLEAQKILIKENYVLLLVSDESQAQILEFKKKTNYDFTFLKATKSNASLGIYALPTTYIYNEKGQKVDKIIGYVKWDSEKIITKLKNIK